MEEIVGYIERFTYQNLENGYAVAQLKEPKKKELTCVVGVMAGVKAGETIRCFGTWKTHLVHGRQFELSHFKTERPADLIGIKKYLGSGLIKGIGPKFAEKIVEKFGTDTLDVIDKDPEKLRQIPGLGEKKFDLIVQCWKEQKSIRDVMIFLQAHGVSPAYANKIFKTYGDQSIEKVNENPYRLAREIFGIGFKMADQIAQKLGVEESSPLRLQAAVEYLLSELSSDGHVCFPEAEFIQHAEAELGLTGFQTAIDWLVDERRLERVKMVSEGKFVPFLWIRNLYLSEQGIATELKRVSKEKSRLRQIDSEKAILWAEKKLNIELGQAQKEAVAQALKEKVLIITGGPGTGKSTITNVILTISQELTSFIQLAAPTGRAAKRMSEITKRPAKTIHSLLEVNFKNGGFKRDRDHPIEADLVVIDEASMIDTALMYYLLRAIPSHARILLIGDINQLPSVGPGNVLKDLIDTGWIPTCLLTEIYRQAKGSNIILNAHRINNGSIPDLRPSKDSDFFFVEEEEADKALLQIRSLVAARLPKNYQLDPITQIQVLAPMKKGVIGTENLNLVLQETLNQNREYIQRSGRRFAKNDKVMQIRNNYQKDVYNGDIGFIQEIDAEEEVCRVSFDGKEIDYEFSELDELILAYAVSIHKYQGSEADCVVIPVHTSHFKLLCRNLLYTGVTRGKKLVVLVGNRRGVIIAVKNDEVKKRYTGLRHFILGSL